MMSNYKMACLWKSFIILLLFSGVSLSSFSQTPYSGVLSYSEGKIGHLYYMKYEKTAKDIIRTKFKTRLFCSVIDTNIYTPVNEYIWYKQNGKFVYNHVDDYLQSVFPSSTTIINNDDSTFFSRGNRTQVQYLGVWAPYDSSFVFKEPFVCSECFSDWQDTIFIDGWQSYMYQGSYEATSNDFKEFAPYFTPENIPNYQAHNAYTIFNAGFYSLNSHMFFSSEGNRFQAEFKNFNMYNQPSRLNYSNKSLYDWSLRHYLGNFRLSFWPGHSDSMFWLPIVESHIYRFNDYDSITSPEPTNDFTIRAQKGVPYTFNFGFNDKEGDSVVLRPMQLYGSGREFHPAINTWDWQTHSQTMTQAQFMSGMRDSLTAAVYEPGYSYQQPFGFTSPYQINAADGSITFTAADTGVYFLVFKMEEYRAGQLLGDVVLSRIAIVKDGPYNTSLIHEAQNHSGQSVYSSSDSTVRMCIGGNTSFTVPVGLDNPAGHLVVSDNHATVFPGSTVSYQYIGTDSARLSFSWSTTPGTQYGYYNLLVTAVDTNCLTNPNRITSSKSFRIFVAPPVGILAGQDRICEGESVTLKALSGTGPYQWSVISGDPSLPCTHCDSITVSPAQTTTYVAQFPVSNCVDRDTFTIKVVPDWTLQVSADTTYCQKLAGGYQIAAMPNPPNVGYTYSWTPAGQLNPSNGQNPTLVAPGLDNTYYVTVKDTFNCFTRSDSVHIKVYDIESGLSPLGDTICKGGTVQLSAYGGQQYQWTPASGLTCSTCPDPVASPQTTTTYRVVITDLPTNCKMIYESEIVVTPSPSVEAGESIIATGGPFRLNGEVQDASHHWWSPGEYLDDSTELKTRGRVSSPTKFTLWGKNAGCEIKDTMTVFYTPCDSLRMPNSFSPNGDGMNDKFLYTNTESLWVEEMEIWNRWGNKVYYTIAIDPEGWDGKDYRTGKDCPSEVYIYRIRVRCNNQTYYTVTGNVTLLR